MVAKSQVSSATTVDSFNTKVFDGYAAELDDNFVAKLLASDDVAWVEEDAIMKTLGTQYVHSSLSFWLRGG